MRRNQAWLLRAQRTQILGIVGFVVLLSVAFSAASSQFLRFGNMSGIGLNASILAIAACAGAIVVLTRNYDLSVGAIMAVSAYIGLDVARQHPGLGPLLVLLPIAIGGACGVVNGLLVAYGRVPSIIATLGTLSVFRGIAVLYANGRQINPGDLPHWMLTIVDARVLGVPILVPVAIAVAAAVAFGLRYLPIGRQIYAVGSNPAAAEFYGLRPQAVVFRAFVLAGLLAGFAGLLLGSHVGYVVPTLATGLELTVLAAVVIGGVSVLGGSGNVAGAAIGALALATIDNGLVLLHVSEFARMLVQGLAIVVAVAVDAVIQRRVGRILRSLKAAGAPA